MSIASGGPSKWRSKYQMEGLKDGEYYNLRDEKNYVIKNGKYVLKSK